MKKYFIIITVLGLTPLHILAQAINVDSLMQELVSKDIIAKVEQHEAIVERISWVSPSILAPTILAILAIAYSLFLHLGGLERKAKAILASPGFVMELDKVINARVLKLAKEKEEAIKAKPVCLIYLPGKDMRKLPKILSDCGFTNVKTYTTEDDFDIAPNTTVVFNDEDGDFSGKISEYIKKNSSVKSKGHFFYFGKKYSDPDFEMRNYANSPDTLAARLFESLTFS